MMNRGKKLDALEGRYDLDELRAKTDATLDTVQAAALIVAACALTALAVYAFTQAVKAGGPR